MIQPMPTAIQDSKSVLHEIKMKGNGIWEAACATEDSFLSLVILLIFFIKFYFFLKKRKLLLSLINMWDHLFDTSVAKE